MAANVPAFDTKADIECSNVILYRRIPRRKTPMRIFIFKSDINPELRAFSDDQDGEKLPAQFRPWHAIGVVRPESVPPHKLNRDVIEASIARDGFQLWQMKK
jgi:hypothetical protein